MKSEAQELSEAVASWLHYKSKVGLQQLLNEASMAVPIAEFLAARHGRDVQSEVAHPFFSQGGLGRPRQIDFVRSQRGNDNVWHSAYETKYQTKDFSAIMSDVCRLVCLAQAAGVGNPNRYFVYAAETPETGGILENEFNTGQGGRTPYYKGLLYKTKKQLGKNQTFSIQNLEERQKSAFREFSKRYCVKIPSSMKIELTGFFRAGGYCCAVWQVWAAQGSKLIQASDF